MIDSYMIDMHITALDDFLKSENILFLNDLSAGENVLSFDALKTWGNSQVLNNYRVAEAYVVDTLADYVFINQHIRLNNLEFEARVFQSVDKANNWLNIFSENHHNI